MKARRNHGTQPVWEECNQITDNWEKEGNCKEQDKGNAFRLEGNSSNSIFSLNEIMMINYDGSIIMAET